MKRTGTTNITSRGSNTTYTISHDSGTCNSTYVLTFRIAATPDSIEYGGQALSVIKSFNTASGFLDIWGIQNSPTGVNDIDVTCPNADFPLYLGAISYALSSKSATFPNVSGSDSKTSGDNTDTVTVSVTTTLDNCILIGLGLHNGLAADALSPGTGTSQISQYNPGTGFDLGMYESDPLNTGTAGSKSLEITLGSINQLMALAVVAIAPSLSRPKLFRKPI